MRALLINPWVYDFKAFDFWNKPLGLLMIAALLKKNGFELDFIDCMDRLSPYYTTRTKTDPYGRGKYLYEIVTKPKIFKEVPRHYKRYGMPHGSFIELLNSLSTPDMIFVTSAMTYWYPGVFEAIRLLKRRFPKTKIILGGIYATLCEKHAKRFSGADIIVTGDGEEKLAELLRKAGIDSSIGSHPAPVIPDFSIYKRLNYGVVLTSRGCPFDCTYCATKILCKKFKTLPEELIIAQLDYFNGKTNNIAFFDDALLYNEHFPAILEKIIQKKYTFNLHASNGLHCRFIDKEIARLMYRANFKTIYLSLETTNPEVQKQTGGKVNTKEFLDAVEVLKKTGFAPEQIHTYILYGMPEQEHQEIIDSIKLCHSLKVHPHLCEFSPIPHTREFEKTGFEKNVDPLYHNNLFYTWYYPHPKPDIYREIKTLLSQKA
ncbi:MAG TPA: radical SAM protein [candidate division WOR-3 bacterium]|uniref:Radical SAM protein n=1 Tax=candidate division WOR-3 bacterium TaxID=2052148 RepID=A0A9C9EKQ2_UNCW3|nr:radical SAM protein [candidate division WOR-3 bacterium]